MAREKLTGDTFYARCPPGTKASADKLVRDVKQSEWLRGLILRDLAARAVALKTARAESKAGKARARGTA